MGGPKVEGVVTWRTPRLYRIEDVTGAREDCDDTDHLARGWHEDDCS